MTPVVIPSPGGDCFAMYGAGSGPAILICPPFGDEALKTARVWRDMAVRLGDYGLATLRFDLPGTGNSAGDPTDPGRVKAWRSGVKACADWLAARHEGRVILFGHRFGALLALDAAAASSVAVERLVLLDPPPSGAALARYLRARAHLGKTTHLPERPDYIQAGGVPLSADTLAALSSLPHPITGSNFPPTLLVLHQTSSAPSVWPERLRGHGSDVETAVFHGYDDFVPHDTFRAKSPRAVLDHVTDYLVRTAGPIQHARSPAEPNTAEMTFGDFTETPLLFGPDQGIFGILCRPDHPARDLPALLLPTTGADPCSGMSRMWTELARRLACQGVVSLRFDMTGVGESLGTLGTSLLAGMYHPDRIKDLKAAVDLLADRGFGDVKVVAYCAGAYAAWHAAVPETRITAILAANLLYLNQQSNLTESSLNLQPGASQVGSPNSALFRLLPSRSIVALRRLDDRTRRIVPRRARLLLRGLANEPKEIRRHVKTLLGRGCRISLVMSNDDHGHMRLRRAFGEVPRLPTGVELTVIRGADHQFSEWEHRARFLDVAADFALRRSPRLSAAMAEPTRALETA